VKLPEGSRRTPPEVKLSEGRRASFRKPKDALFSKQVQKAEGRAFFKTSWLPSESRHPARGEAFRRKPKEAKDALPSGGSRRTRFFQNKFIKPKDALFSKQVQKAEERAFFKTSSLPSASLGKPPPRQR